MRPHGADMTNDRTQYRYHRAPSVTQTLDTGHVDHAVTNGIETAASATPASTTAQDKSGDEEAKEVA